MKVRPDAPDVFSMAIVLWEMVTCCIKSQYYAPYTLNAQPLNTRPLLKEILENKKRPEIPSCDPNLKSLIENMWADDPQNKIHRGFERPRVKELYTPQQFKGKSRSLIPLIDDWEKNPLKWQKWIEE